MDTVTVAQTTNLLQSVISDFLFSLLSGAIAGLVAGLILLKFQFKFQLEHEDQAILLKASQELQSAMDTFEASIILIDYENEFAKNVHRKLSTKAQEKKLQKIHLALAENLMILNKSLYHLRSVKNIAIKLFFQKLEKTSFFSAIDDSRTKEEILEALTFIESYLGEHLSSAHTLSSFFKRKPSADEPPLSGLGIRLARLAADWGDSFHIGSDGKLFPWLGRFGDWSDERNREAVHELKEMVAQGLFSSPQNSIDEFNLTLKGLIAVAKSDRPLI